MLFNTFEFAVFFAIVYTLYLSLNHKRQNWALLGASYIFYGAWDWRFLSLLWISTLLDYFCGIKIGESREIKRKKLFLWASVVGNLTILGFFKYFDFFAENFELLLRSFGIPTEPRFLRIILPVGISFYTFQSMSYSIDIYRGILKPTRNLLDFALFVAFFPQLVAGPIERARHLLPQIQAPRRLSLDQFYEGSFLIFWGLFQKVFIADNLARIVDPIFAGPAPYEGIKVLLALYAFAFQIYCDFAGYSNIARGLGKCMGFDIVVNFNLPYFAAGPREFWQRWHISLSTWLRDYLYIPLGGNRKGALKTYRNVGLTMLLGGLWHGAAWTFVFWGAYHGMLLMAERLLQPFVPHGKFWQALKIVFCLHLVCFGWLLFRAESLAQVAAMGQALLFNFQFFTPWILQNVLLPLVFYSWILVLIQVLQYWKNDLLAILKFKPAFRSAFYFCCFYLLVLFGAGGGKAFIYYQF